MNVALSFFLTIVSGNLWAPVNETSWHSQELIFCCCPSEKDHILFPRGLYTFPNAHFWQNRTGRFALSACQRDSALSFLWVTSVIEDFQHVQLIFRSNIEYRCLPIDVFLINSASLRHQVLHCLLFTVFTQVEHHILVVLVFKVRVRSSLNQDLHDLLALSIVWTKCCEEYRGLPCLLLKSITNSRTPFLHNFSDFFYISKWEWFYAILMRLMKLRMLSSEGRSV